VHAGEPCSSCARLDVYLEANDWHRGTNSGRTGTWRLKYTGMCHIRLVIMHCALNMAQVH
jgi:hypothetical protein